MVPPHDSEYKGDTAAGTGAWSSLGDAEFRRLKDFIESHWGIALDDEKKLLLESRLSKLIAEKGYPSFEAFCDDALDRQGGECLSDLFDRVSTNHTHFYREPGHFDLLSKTVLDERLDLKRKQHKKDLRVWCAACSSGEEAYMLAILVRQALGAEAVQWQAGVLATDLSSRILERAKQGVYKEDNVEHMPAELRERYFAKLPSGDYQVDPSIRKEVTFRRLNLMNAQPPFKQGFDIIFCRNVMIYFTPETQSDLVKRLYDLTLPGGYLFVGHSEALDRSRSPYEFVQPGVHRKSSAV